jgi:hypothetical protein
MESITTIRITDIPWNMGAREFNLMFKFHNGFMSGRLTDVYSHRGKTGWATFLSVECANIAIHVLNDLYVGDRHFLRVDWANKNLKATSRNSRSTSAQTWQTSEQTWQTSEHAWQTSTWQWNPDMEDSGTQAWQPWTPTPEPGIPTQTWNTTYPEPAAKQMPKRAAGKRRQAETSTPLSGQNEKPSKAAAGRGKRVRQAETSTPGPRGKVVEHEDTSQAVADNGGTHRVRQASAWAAATASDGGRQGPQRRGSVAESQPAKATRRSPSSSSSPSPGCRRPRSESTN